MRILACDTSISFGSVCLLEEGKIVSSIKTDERHKQAEILIPNVEKLLSKFKLDYRDLDVLAVTTGPGSFTGVRIGLSAIKGIALAGELKVIGITTLQSMTESYRGKLEGNIIAVLNAGRNQVYIQEFDKNLIPINNINLIDIEKIPYGNKTVVGNITADNIIYHAPNAEEVALYAFNNQQLADDGDNIEPTYIRPPDAVPCK